MFYIDTSVIITFLTDEADAPKVEAWFSEHDSLPFVASDWTWTETASALAIKHRTDQISAEKHQAAISEFHLMLDTSFRLLPIKQAHFRTAASYCHRFDLGLRSGDALHLAVALDVNAEIITLDKRFAAAAKTLGARCTLL